MKKNQYSPKQIVDILREMDAQEAPSVVALCQKYGISRQTYYYWRAKYGKLDMQMARIRKLEMETRELRRLVAQQHSLLESLLHNESAARRDAGLHGAALSA